MPRKPTGIIHRAVVSPGTFDVRRLQFPEEKAAIEALIVEIYSVCLVGVGVNFFVGQQNSMNDLDFNAKLDGRDGYLELTEIAPLGADGYGGAASSYEVLPFAEAIADQVHGKANKYAGIRERPIALLLYTTDWKFPITEQVSKHLAFLLSGGGHRFSRIDIVEPREDGSGSLIEVFPSNRQDWSDYDPQSLAGLAIFVADVSKPLPRDKWPGRGRKD